MLITVIVRWQAMTRAAGIRAIVECTEGCSNNSKRNGMLMPLSKDCRDHRVEIAAKALESEKPLDIVNKYMIPALDFVGHGFEKKTLFLPQLLMSADAAKAAFEDYP